MQVTALSFVLTPVSCQISICTLINSNNPIHLGVMSDAISHSMLHLVTTKMGTAEAPQVPVVRQHWVNLDVLFVRLNIEI